MGIFYHYSHFLELLAGLYFGGIALLAFIEEKASVSLVEKFKGRKDEASRSKTLAREYFQVRIRLKENGDGFWRVSVGMMALAIYNIFVKPCNWLFKISSKRVERMAKGEKTKTLQKKFFPSFIYCGIFCMVIMLVGAMQYEHINKPNCQSTSDNFMVFYLLSSGLFLIYSLFIHPFIVNKKDYLHSIFCCILLIILLLTLSIFGITNNWLPDIRSWLLLHDHEMKLVAITLSIATLPLLIILFYTVSLFLFWEGPIFVNKCCLFIFKKRKIGNEIESLIP